MGTKTVRRTAALTILAVALVAAGCGSSGSSNYSSSSTPSTTASATSATSASTAATSSAAGAAGGAGSPQVLPLAADSGGALSYSTTTLTAKPGKVTIVFTNTAPLSHNVTVASSAGTTLGATPTFSGGAKSLTLNLPAGTYTFFCSVPGHRQAGMQGTLTVG
jgi:plastocyanin